MSAIASSRSRDEQRSTALASAWIRRLSSNPQPHASIPLAIPFHLHLSSPLQLLSKINGFGSFRIQIRNDADRRSQEGESKLENLVDESSSLIRVYKQKQHDALTIKRSASRARNDEHSAASRKFYNHQVVNLNASQHISSHRRSNLSSEPEEPFSYWNMGRQLERKNFVCSVTPVTTSAIAPVRKRTANNTYGFISSKFRRICNEG